MDIKPSILSAGLGATSANICATINSKTLVCAGAAGVGASVGHFMQDATMKSVGFAGLGAAAGYALAKILSEKQQNAKFVGAMHAAGILGGIVLGDYLGDKFQA